MHALVRTVFSRLHSLDPEAEEAKLLVVEDIAQEGEIKMSVSTDIAAPGNAEPNLAEKVQPEEKVEEAMIVPPTPGLPRSECAFH